MEIRGSRMIKIVLTGVILSNLFLSLMPAQQNKNLIIEWEKIREAFEAYYKSPSAANADNILTILPRDFDNRTANLYHWGDTLEYIWQGTTFNVLKNQILKGDRLAIRISLRTLIISDGAFAESLCGLISESIKPNPLGYLEEATAFRKYAPRMDFIILDTVLPEFYGSPEEDPKGFAEFKKEVQERVWALETVSRPDLIELRDKCISRLIRAIRERGSAKRGEYPWVYIRSVRNGTLTSIRPAQLNSETGQIAS
jgi:hypothetical protein